MDNQWFELKDGRAFRDRVDDFSLLLLLGLFAVVDLGRRFQAFIKFCDNVVVGIRSTPAQIWGVLTHLDHLLGMPIRRHRSRPDLD